MMRDNPTRRTAEKLAAAKRLHKRGIPLAAIARTVGISRQTLWLYGIRKRRTNGDTHPDNSTE